MRSMENLDQSHDLNINGNNNQINTQNNIDDLKLDNFKYANVMEDMRSIYEHD